MAVTADRVVVELEARLDKYNADVAKAQNQFDRSMGGIKQSADRAEQGVDKSFKGMASSAASGAAAIGRAGLLVGASLAAVAAGFVAAGAAAVRYAANLSDLSRQTGISVEQLQVLERAGIEGRFSLEQAAGAVANLSEKLGEAKSGNAEALRLFASIGITPEQIRSINDGAGLLVVLADRISELGTRAEQSAAAQRFGVSELLPLLRQGAEGFDRFAREAAEAGVLTGEQADQAREAQERLEALALTIKTSLTSALLTVLPYLENIISALGSVGSAAGWAWDQLQRVGNAQLPGGASIGGLMNGSAGFQMAMANASPQQRAAFLARAQGSGGQAGILAPFLQTIAQTRVPPRRLGSTDAPSSARARRGPRDRTAQIEERFSRELARLNEEALRAQAELTSDLEQRRLLLVELAQMEYDERLRQVNDNRDFTEAQKTALRDRINQLYDVGPDGSIGVNSPIFNAIARDINGEQLRRSADVASQRLDAEEETLGIANELADTQAERRRIEMRLIDIAIERAQTELDGLHASQTHERAQAQARLDSLRSQRAASQEVARRRTASPGEAYLNSINAAGTAMNEQVEGVVVDGFERLNDELAESATRFLRLGGVAGDVLNDILSGIIRIGIQQRLIQPLANALFGGGGFGGGASGGSILDAAMKLAPGAFATGGSFTVGGRAGVDRNVLSINGTPVARVSRGETGIIVPQGRSFGAMPGPVAARSRGGTTINVNIDAQDAVLTHSVRGWVREGVEEAVARGTSQAVQVTEQRAFRRARQAL